MSVATAEKSKTEQFSEKTLQIINHAALALMMSIGHRTRLFDTMADLPPATAGTIAEAAGLNERYVREWLGRDGHGRHRRVPRGLGLLPSAPGACRVPHARGEPEQRRRDVAVGGRARQRRGRGGRRLPARPRRAVQRVSALSHGDGGREPADRRRRPAEPHPAVVARAPSTSWAPVSTPSTSRAAAAAPSCSLAETFPQSRFTGVDLSAEAIAAGRARSRGARPPQRHARPGRCGRALARGHVHLITAFDAIHDQARPARVLERVHAALRPGGVFLMQDIAGHTQAGGQHESCPWTVHRTQSRACTACRCRSRPVGPGLGAMWGREKALEMLAAAGFTNVRVAELPHDPINDYYVAVKTSMIRFHLLNPARTGGTLP